jgi:uncharacterized protein (TIGR03118 family)
MRKFIYTIAALGVATSACSDDDDSSTMTPEPTPGAARVVARGDIAADQAGATTMDPTLVNAWGLAFNPIGAAWVSAAGTGLSGVYDATGKQLIPSVSIPTAAGQAPPSEPTGQVFNGDEGAFMGDRFIFVTTNGTIAGWQPSNGAQAMLRVDSSPGEAAYTGVTIAKDAAGTSRLIAADFHNNKIDVFDAGYMRMNTSGNFRDPQVPADFAPFNVQEHEGAILIAFAKQDEEREEEEKGIGLGYVDVFSIDGALMQRVVAQGALNAPWGMVMTPASFSAAPNRLLIGNFGDGRILVYNWSMTMTRGGPVIPPPSEPVALAEGALRTGDGRDLLIDGLWDIKFGVDAGGFSSRVLYFTAGPDEESHGVFGRLEPAALNSPSGTGGAGGAGGTGSSGAGGSSAGAGGTY